MDFSDGALNPWEREEHFDAEDLHEEPPEELLEFSLQEEDEQADVEDEKEPDSEPTTTHRSTRREGAYRHERAAKPSEVEIPAGR